MRAVAAFFFSYRFKIVIAAPSGGQMTVYWDDFTPDQDLELRAIRGNINIEPFSSEQCNLSLAYILMIDDGVLNL